MEDESSSNPPMITKEETQKKLKEDIVKLFNQLKNGCYRKYCYNIYCKKNNQSTKKYANKSDKELITECLKLIHSNNNEQLFCISSEDIKSIESFFDSLTKNSSLNFNDGDSQGKYPKLNLDFEKIKEIYKANEKDHKLFEDHLNQINNYFSQFYSSADLKSDIISEKSIASIFYLYNYQIKALFYVLSNPDLSLSELNVQEFDTFFQNFRKMTRFSKKYLSGNDNNSGKGRSLEAYIDSFTEVKEHKEEFKAMVANCQTFITLILISINSRREDEEEDEEEEQEDNSLINLKMRQLLVNFVKSFETLFNINEAYSLLNYREFYNDGFSKHLNIKKECKVYNKILKKKYEGKKPFCLINYIWLFDPAAKNEIFRVFNTNKQSTEIFNSIHSMEEDGLFSMPLMSVSSLFLVLKIRRNHLIEDTLNAVSISSINLQKPLKVKFENEQGVDEGGVRKEFFMLLVRQIFDPNFGMFSYNDNRHFFWFNLYSFEPKIKYELIGILLGLALFNDVILDIKFPLVIYKKLLDQPLELEDMSQCDPDLYQTLTYLKNTTENDLKEVLSMNFTVTVDKFGEKIEIPLKPKGDEIYIDNSNKEEYIKLYLDWYFNKSIEEFFLYFKNGFYRACNRDLAKLLKAEELELIICGTQKLDFYELEKSTRYDDGYESDSLTCKLFWEVLHTFTEEEKRKFLFFLTGCDRAPINGLRYLFITISRYGPDSDKLPCAHTCFNHLLLPDYGNKEKLRKLILIAINNSEGFGMI